MAIVILKRNETDSRLPRIKNARLLTYEEMKKYNSIIDHAVSETSSAYFYLQTEKDGEVYMNDLIAPCRELFAK